MTDLDMRAARASDVLIAGAGLAGLVAAFGFARAGFDAVSCGADERSGRGRTVALLDRSVAYLDSLGLWAPLAGRAAPLRALRLIDDTGTLFPPRPVEFHSSEIGLDAFGWNIENDAMAEALGAEIAGFPGVERLAAGVAAYDFSGGAVHARLKDGRAISARLAVGADGRASPARRAAGLEARTHRYPQSALTALLAHRAAARGLFDRVPHPRRPVHAGAVAGQRWCAPPVEPGLGDVGRGSAPPRGARR